MMNSVLLLKRRLQLFPLLTPPAGSRSTAHLCQVCKDAVQCAAAQTTSAAAPTAHPTCRQQTCSSKTADLCQVCRAVQCIAAHPTSAAAPTAHRSYACRHLSVTAAHVGCYTVHTAGIAAGCCKVHVLACTLQAGDWLDAAITQDQAISKLRQMQDPAKSHNSHLSRVLCSSGCQSAKIASTHPGSSSSMRAMTMLS
jgi:hypothetical protein